MLFIFIITLFIAFLCMRLNSVRMTGLNILFAVVLSAIPLVNVVFLVLGLVELSIITYRRFTC